MIAVSLGMSDEPKKKPAIDLCFVKDGQLSM